MTASLYVVLGLLGLSLLALAVTGAPIYARLSYLWGFLLVGSKVWAVLALRGIELQRRTRTQRARVGQILEELFEIQNGSRLPRLWLEVHNQAVLPGSRGSRVLTLVKGRQRRSYSVRTRLVQRGVFTLGPTVLASGDLFGLFPVSRTVPSDASLLVYPMMVEVRAFPSPPGLLPGGEALRRRTHQVTPNAAGVREYEPGDSLSRIHWLSTARREHLMVKEFELDPLADVWIFLDAAREVQAALPYTPASHAAHAMWRPYEAMWRPYEEVELPPSTEEYAVCIAASLGRYFLRRRRAVGLVSYSQSPGRGPNVLPPDRGGRQLGKILEALALLRAEGDLPISALLTAQAQHLPRGSTVILITPSVREEVALAVDVLLRRGLRPVVVLLDAASFGGPPGTAALAAAITMLNVPLYQVTNGADLGTVLSMNSV
ncbi:MAG: DUF58 domain-containing protein [Anaerolineae bacterium]